MNYTELCTAIAEYAENEFTADQLALFVTQAEQRIYNMVQLPSLRKTSTLTMTISDPYVDCPTDFLAPYSLAVIDPTTGGYTFLLNKDTNFMREAYPLPTTTGTPKYYAIMGPATDEAELRFIVAPTPVAAYSAELQYFYYPESISVAVSGTTWLGYNYSPALLYGALVEAYTFMKGETDMMTLYDSKFKEALTQLKRLGDGMDRQDSYRSGQLRMPVK